MKSNEDIRWKQRLNSFSHALSLLEEACQITDPSDLEKEGTLQRFEFAQELSWKLLKDYLSDQGHTDIIGAKSAYRLSFNLGILAEGQVWLDMIESRNQTVHRYSEEVLENEYRNVKERYLNSFKQLYNYFQSKI